MHRKHQQSIYRAITKVNLIEENVIQINGGIIINVDVSAKNVMNVKKIIFEILLHVIAKIEIIWQVLWMI